MALRLLEKIESEIHYDLILTDHDLPDVDSIEIVRQTRRLTHPQRTPTIIFTASSVDKEAYAVVVDPFLRKPEDIHLISS